MAATKLNENNELTLLANWIKGNHREDLELFPPEVFNYGNLHNATLSGPLKAEDITRLYIEKKTNGVLPVDIVDAAAYNGSAGGELAEMKYNTALKESLTDCKMELIRQLKEPGADIYKVTEQLTTIQNRIDKREVKPAARGLAYSFIEELEDDKKKGRVEYGKGFEDLDRQLKPMKAGQLVIFAARPGTGKSAVALQIGYNAALAGHKVLFFTLEMPINQMLERLLVQRYVIDSLDALESPTGEEVAKIYNFLNKTEIDGNFLLYDGTANNLEEIQQIIREEKPELVVIDQLSFVTPTAKTKDIREKFINVTVGLKAAAMESGTVVLALSQTNRDAESKARPTLANLAESDSIGQTADTVILLQNEGDAWETPEGEFLQPVSFTVDKNRQGRAHFTEILNFFGSKFMFRGESYKQDKGQQFIEM